jgi:hypothetical protein
MADIERRQCRYLKSDGTQCNRGNFQHGEYCYQHGRDTEHRRRKAAFTIDVPLLDSREAIQSVVTQMVRATLDGSLGVERGRAVNGMLRTALKALPLEVRNAKASDTATPRMRELRKQKNPAAAVAPPPPETVAEAQWNEEIGEFLAPEVKYYGPSGKPERAWSYSEWQYRLSFKDFPEREHQPLPEEGFRTDLEGTRYVESDRFWRPKLPSDVEAIEENERHMRIVHANKIALGQIPEGTPYETECGMLLRASQKWQAEQAAKEAAGPVFNPADFPPEILERWNDPPE